MKNSSGEAFEDSTCVDPGEHISQRVNEAIEKEMNYVINQAVKYAINSALDDLIHV